MSLNIGKIVRRNAIFEILAEGRGTYVSEPALSQYVLERGYNGNIDDIIEEASEMVKQGLIFRGIFGSNKIPCYSIDLRGESK